ncbi:helix-turn-helix transcriptional regulator [Tenggerimyces flavus]|uniref:AAA family ATPase n=1 Tax=Tenggerimyces flavus TaxID=1708749 RepID=A0ABV7YE23_9ACTN|nr:helix-turn-helix transcriptional regulator [Tenggerimyces flavus]MBM7783378.1 DNA-binding CsgD family transcriptional regulator [Tenggerimyces flavus]
MLRGRENEQAAIDALLDGARAGTSGALVLRGEPGIGKTALLRYAADRADGLRVLRGSGTEFESELPFAGLHLLLRPALDRLDALPARQREALTSAFGLGEVGAVDRFMIGAGVLSLLAELAENEPVVCLVDDAHWLDRASAEALRFAARRLDREGVVLLFAIREHATTFASGALAELRLAGLDTASAGALLDERNADLPAEVRQRLIDDTRGNPLALLELPAVLASSGAPPGPMPLTNRVLDAFHQQVRNLPATTQTWLLLAAADDTGELAVLRPAGTALQVEITDLQPAQDSGMLSLESGALVFRHPLLRAAAYHGAPLAPRIAAHQALATAYRDRGDVDREAWQLAFVATGPDERVAAGLEHAADRALRRSGYVAAATAYERSAQLSESTEQAVRRLALACEAGANGGQLDWARARAERASRDATESELTARLVEVQASADFAQGELGRAHTLLTTGARAIAAEDTDRAFWMLMRALHCAWATPTDERLLADSLDAFDTLQLPADDPRLALVWLARWGMAVPLGRDVDGYPPLEDVVARATAAAKGPTGRIEVTSRAFICGLDDEGIEAAMALVAEARNTGVIYALPAGLGYLALLHAVLGNRREARIAATEGIAIARDTGQPLWVSYASGALAYVAAMQGDEVACQRHTEEAGLRLSLGVTAAGATWAQFAQALLDLGLGRIQGAFDRLQALASGPTRHQNANLRAVPDLVEAATRLGRVEEVTASLELYGRYAKAMRRPWIEALYARCLALTEQDAEPHFQRALTLHDDKSRLFERARTELLYGEWLRRARRRTDAREQLTSALQAFEELSAGPWAARARSELSAAGAAVTRTAASDVLAALTPQELQISQLAAQGMSNNDIAAQLFLSSRTVAYHLYKAYPKLGISSRSELAALL